VRSTTILLTLLIWHRPKAFPHLFKICSSNDDLNECAKAVPEDFQKEGTLVAIVFTCKAWDVHANYNGNAGPSSQAALEGQTVSIPFSDSS
jgi:hypothetical protein